MTRHEYELIAETLADYMPMNTQDVDYGVSMANWLDIVNNFAVNLGRANPEYFDKELFLKNCGVAE